MARRPGGVVAMAAALSLALLLHPGPSSAGGFHQRGPVLVSSSADRPLFAGPAMRPGEVRSRCLSVTGLGAQALDVRLFARSGGGLGPYLHLRVAEGSGPCSSFRPDRTLFTGTLAEFPTSYGAGIPDVHARWAPGASHAYRFTARLTEDPRGQGRSATVSFRWRARSP